MKPFLNPLISLPLLIYLFLVPIGLLAMNNYRLSLPQSERVVEGSRTAVVAHVSPTSFPLVHTPIVSPELMTPIHEPYGITSQTLTSDEGVQIHQLGVTWVRLPILWSTIETGPGAYDWRHVDDMVSLAAASGVHIDFVITNAPEWHMAVCTETATHFAFGASDVSTFASILATRYNGLNNHGFISAYEIGGEEFDTYGSDTTASDLACRSPGYYLPVLQAGYRAIKAASPKALVGMFGLGTNSKQQESSYLEGLYALDPLIGSSFDFGNVHYYNTTLETAGDPLKPVLSNTDFPTLADKISLMKQAFIKHKSVKPIWVSEVGWKQPFVSESQQNTYLGEVLATAKQLAVSKVFWYSLDSDGYGLLSQGKPTQTFYGLQQWIKKTPTW